MWDIKRLSIAPIPEMSINIGGKTTGQRPPQTIQQRQIYKNKYSVILLYNAEWSNTMVQSAKIVLEIAVASEIMSVDLPGALVLYALQKLSPFFMKKADKSGQLLYAKLNSMVA